MKAGQRNEKIPEEARELAERKPSAVAPSILKTTNPKSKGQVYLLFPFLQLIINYSTLKRKVNNPFQAQREAQLKSA